MAFGNSFNGRIVADRRLQQNVGILRRIVPDATKGAVNVHALNVQRVARNNITEAPAVDTGRLRTSVKITPYQNGFAATVGTDLDYGVYVEMGTGPRSKFPPLEPIRQWCRRHNIPESAAFLIARKIKQKGTPAKPWLFPAFESEQPKFEDVINQMMQIYARELAL